MLLILDFKIFQSVIFIIQQSEIVLQEKKHLTELEFYMYNSLRILSPQSKEIKAQKTLKNKYQESLVVKDIYGHSIFFCARVFNSFWKGIKHTMPNKKRKVKEQDYLTVVEPEAHVLLLYP